MSWTIDQQPGTTIPDSIAQAADGRLVLVGGNHGVATLFAADAAPVDPRVFVANHHRRRAWTAARQIGFSQWVFPDPILFSGAMPPGRVRSVLRRALPDQDLPDLHYPCALIQDHADRIAATDSHYSPIGNLHLAGHVAQVMLGIDPAAIIAAQLAQLSPPARVEGDLGVQCSPPIAEMRRGVGRPDGMVTASNGLQAGNMGIMQLVDSPQSLTERRLLIFGDSFFRVLLPELARYWRRIVFCRTNFFHAEMVEAVAPTDILCGMAERYFASSKPDAQRPHFLAWPLILGRAAAPDPGFAALWTAMVDQQRLAQV